MAYKIRYGRGINRRRDIRTLVQLQLLTAGALLMAVSLVQFWERGAGVVRLFLTPDPMSLGEQALAACAQALSGGEEWYQALAVWCRRIMDGAAA